MKVNLPKLRALLQPLKAESFEKKHLVYSGDPKIDELIHSDPFAFLIGVISDQMIPSERAWRVPALLKERLGDLKIEQIAQMKIKELEEVMRIYPSLHRFPHIMARNFIMAARFIIEKYGGDVSKMWNEINLASEIQRRLLEIPGISQKKSSMMTKMLVRDWGLKVNDLHEINLPFDIHIRRVLLRLGLAEDDTIPDIQAAGRQLHAEYPADYDDAIWLVGRRFCHPEDPDHTNCPLGKVCQKLNKNAGYAEEGK